MQLVLSNNRVLAHGENFISMGGTVINTETNKVYQNATVAECDGCPSDIDTVGYEYHAGDFVPCAPYGVGDGNIMVACQEDCGTPKDSRIPLSYTVAMPIYLAFVGNINTALVNAAFGENNEDNIKGVGCALAMYAKYHNPSIVLENSFPNLITCQNLSDMCKKPNAVLEYMANDTLKEFIHSNDYAFSELWVEKANEFMSISTKNGSFEASDTRTIALTITDEHIAGTKKIYCNAYLNCTEAPSSVTALIRINNRVLLAYPDSNAVLEVDNLLDLNEYGITSPGTYEVVLNSQITNHGNANANVSIKIYETKGE